MPRHAKSTKAARKRRLEADLQELVARARAYLESRFGRSEPQLEKLGLEPHPGARKKAKGRSAPPRVKAAKGRAPRKPSTKTHEKPSRGGRKRPRAAASKRRTPRSRRGPG